MALRFEFWGVFSALNKHCVSSIGLKMPALKYSDKYWYDAISAFTAGFYYFSDPSVLQATLAEHTNAVWGLSMHSSKMQLLSCSADATVKLWNPTGKIPLLNTFRVDAG